MTPLQLKRLPAEEQELLKLIHNVIKSNKFWWAVRQLDLYDDSVQDLYLHVMFTRREKLIGRDDRYIVGALQNRLRDFLLHESWHGRCSKGGGTPSTNPEETMIDASKGFMSEDGDMDAFNQFESTWQPEPYEVLAEEARAEAEYELLDNEKFQRLALACSAKSLPSKAAIIGSNKHGVGQCMQANFEQLRADIQVRLGRYAC